MRLQTKIQKAVNLAGFEYEIVKFNIITHSETSR